MPCTSRRFASQSAHNLADSERTRCEIWSRVMGYHRPTTAFNAGKRQEHRDRKLFQESRA